MVAESVNAEVRPTIRRAFDLVDYYEYRRIYRVNVQVMNGDSTLISSIFIPYEQTDWSWSRPGKEEYQSSFLEIRGSQRAGTGMWKERIPQEVWYPATDRVWAAECELGGIEKGAVLDLVFFAETDEMVDPQNRSLRIGYGTCGEELHLRSDQYWSTVSGLLTRRVASEETLQVFRYAGYADTLVLYNMTCVKGIESPQGWSVLEQDQNHVVLVSEGVPGGAEFAIRFARVPGTTGFFNWRDSSVGINHGYVLGPGCAEYSVLDALILVAEPGWKGLLQGLSATFLLVVFVVVVLRVQRRTKR